MTDTDKPQLHGADKVENPSVFARFLHATEIDARLLGMIGALVLIWIGFHLIWADFQRLRCVPNPA